MSDINQEASLISFKWSLKFAEKYLYFSVILFSGSIVSLMTFIGHQNFPQTNIHKLFSLLGFGLILAIFNYGLAFLAQEKVTFEHSCLIYEDRDSAKRCRKIFKRIRKWIMISGVLQIILFTFAMYFFERGISANLSWPSEQKNTQLFQSRTKNNDPKKASLTGNFIRQKTHHISSESSSISVFSE